MEIKLRDYQLEVYNGIKNELRKGNKGVVAVLPCRSGKSFVMAKIASDANKKNNHVLILAHRNSLINQHKELFKDLECDNGLTRIESVFTEVNHLGEKGPVDVIIIDEAHISGASSYQKVCEYYNCTVILFTATPARTDGKPLSLATSMVKGISAKELIKQGKISDYLYYAPDLKINLDKVEKTAGDYNNKQLGDVMRKATIYGDVLKYYNMLAKDKQAICYCVNVEHSKDVCEMFNNNGILAKHMDAKTNEKDREKILKEFKEGKFKILCNCNLISEGITLPTAEAGLLLRPTQSMVLYIQQSMRCLTPMENKKAIIIDYVGNVFRHGLPTQDRNWSLNSKVKEYNNIEEDGTFKIRVCQECFSTFEAAPVCPYCGATYETTAVEIQNKKDIELKKIEEAKEAKRQAYLDNLADKVSNYKDIKECRTFAEMTQFCKNKGYKPGYAYVMAKRLNITIHGRK